MTEQGLRELVAQTEKGRLVNQLIDAFAAIGELCARHGLATGHSDTLADIIREVDGQITERRSPSVSKETQ